MVYLMICADILVGVAPNYNGVLCEIFQDHTGVWYLSREFVVVVLVVLVVIPLYSLRCALCPLVCAREGVTAGAGACMDGEIGMVAHLGGGAYMRLDAACLDSTVVHRCKLHKPQQVSPHS
jgi:hypothetical protein